MSKIPKAGGSGPRAPKPKPKKKAKPKKLNTGPKIKAFDFVETALNADAGAQSFRDNKDSYRAAIQKFSKPQLDRLSRRIQRIRKKAMESSNAEEELDAVCVEISEFIETRLQRSRSCQAELDVSIKNCISKLTVSKVRRRPSGRLLGVYIDDKYTPISDFIKQYFHSQLERARSLLDEGELIRPHEQHGAQAIIKQAIDSYLTDVPAEEED